MRHEYTDIEMTAAADIAVTQTSSTYSAVGLPYLRAFLDALPEPQDDWQQCTFEDVSMFDESVLFVFDDGTKVQGKPYSRNKTDIYMWVGDLAYVISLRDVKKGKATIYRKPKKIDHPNPAEHPVIIVHLHNGVKETKRAFVWNGESYGCLDGPHSFLAPHQITEWSPAKVVADNDC